MSIRRASSSATRPGLKVVKIAQTVFSGRYSSLWGGCDDYLPSAANTDRHEYIVNVQFDCALAYSQFTRDFLIGKALLNQHRNLLLAGGQYAAPFCGFEDIWPVFEARTGREQNAVLHGCLFFGPWTWDEKLERWLPWGCDQQHSFSIIAVAPAPQASRCARGMAKN